MKSNKQGKIRVPKSGFKRSRFNWTHDVNTTFTWGELQPTQCKLLIPGSKTTFSSQSLIRLAPMVAPTFGRVKYKTYNQFVSLAEVMPNFDAMMAQEPVTTAFGTKVPQAIPTISLGLLSSWVLNGCHGTMYWKLRNGDAFVEGRYVTEYRESPIDANDSWDDSFTALAGVGIDKPFDILTDPYNRTSNGILPNVGARVCINLNKFGSRYAQVFGTGNQFQVVTAMKDITDMCPVIRGWNNAVNFEEAARVQDYQAEVTFESADYVLESDSGFALCVELSDFGKRLRKILQGCGYQIDFTSTTQVSILPLLATYKAYFDIFGLELYQGWETTYCSKLIKYIENNFLSNVGDYFVRRLSTDLVTATNENSGIFFMMQEVGNMFYTDDVDYVSAHIDALSVSPTVSTEEFLNVNDAGSVLTSNGLHLDDATFANGDLTNSSQDMNYAAPGINGESLGALSWINNVNHSQIDAEMLKRLYKWTNRNTVLGRRIAEILRAQGLGKYVDECKSNYIGSTDTLVTISDVVSTAATEDAALGQYGGKGLQYTENKTLVFENDSYGYWITLATVVPESGYTQGLDPTLTAVSKMGLYNPDFDALGMEATTKETVVGTNYLVGPVSDKQNTFGFIPMYSKFKVAHNLVNGDFNRHGKRNTYMPYTLDKQLYINDFEQRGEKYSADTLINQVLVDVSNRYLPHAGNVWRYPTKYNWLGNFDRIFLRVNEQDDVEVNATSTGALNSTELVGFADYGEDNFLSHSIYEVQCYAPMKPIVDSYGLDEDDPMIGSGAEYIAKA